MKVFPHPWQRPRRIPNPVVMFIVRLLAPATATDDGIASQTGHRRRMTLSQSPAQSVSSLCGGAESGIKRIVVQGGLYPGADPPRSEPEVEPLLLKRKSQLKKNNASQLRPLEVLI